MQPNNKAILNEANAAITAADYERFLSFCTEDSEWTFVGEQTLRGKEAIRQYMATAYIEPPKFTVEHIIAENEFVTAIGEITMKDKNGKAIVYSYCDVWRFRDSKMAELKAFVIEAR